MRLIVLIFSVAIGFLVGTYIFDSGSSRYYVFKLYPKDSNPSKTRPAKGFACKCTKISNVLSWQGWPDNGCNSGTPDAPLSLGDAKLGTNKMTNPPPIPTGACCKPIPKINGTVMPGVHADAC